MKVYIGLHGKGGVVWYSAKPFTHDDKVGCFDDDTDGHLHLTEEEREWVEKTYIKKYRVAYEIEL